MTKLLDIESSLSLYDKNTIRLDYIEQLGKERDDVRSFSKDNTITVIFPAGDFYQNIAAIAEFTFSEDAQRFNFSFQSRIGVDGLQVIKTMRNVFNYLVGDTDESLMKKRAVKLAFEHAIAGSNIGTEQNRALLIEQVRLYGSRQLEF